MDKGELEIIHSPGDEILGDSFTKPLQVAKFLVFKHLFWVENEYYLRGIIVVVQLGSKMARTIVRRWASYLFGYNFAKTCVGSTRRGDNIALVLSKRIVLKWCKSVGRLLSHVHDRVDVFADQDKVLMVMNLLYFGYFAAL